MRAVPISATEKGVRQKASLLATDFGEGPEEFRWSVKIELFAKS